MYPVSLAYFAAAFSKYDTTFLYSFSNESFFIFMNTAVDIPIITPSIAIAASNSTKVNPFLFFLLPFFIIFFLTFVFLLVFTTIT